jgi:hypothetical protein
MAQRYASSTTPLAATGAANSADTWTATLEAGSADSVVGAVYADQPGTLYIEQSMDGGKNWDVSSSYPVVASDGSGFSEAVLCSLLRIRYVNTGGAQAAFRIQARLSSAGPRP